MSLVYGICALFIFVLIIAGLREVNFKKIVFNPLFIIIASGILVRLFALSIDLRFETDINCFKAWSLEIFSNGFSSFYLSDSFSDYPPGYMYVLWLLGLIKTIMGLNDSAFTILIMMPPIICDIITACFIYKIAKTKTDEKVSAAMALLYVLNPAVIINSSVWGQVDSVHTLMIFSSLYLLIKKKYTFSFPLFVLAVLVKPQSLMFSPIYIYFFFKLFKPSSSQVFKDTFKAAFKEMGAGIGLSFALLIVPLIPFSSNGDFAPIVSQYINTLASYPYASINAYNFYALNGLNWAPLTSEIAGIPVSFWGYGSIVITCIISFVLLWKNDSPSNVFFTAAFLNTATYMFSIKMHERYIFPALLMLLVSYIFEKNKKVLIIYIGFSVTVFLNCLDVLNVINQNGNYELIKDSMPVISLINMILIFIMFFICVSNEKDITLIPMEKDAYFSQWNLTENFKFTKYDTFFICILTVFYGVFAFTFLGDFKSPQNPWQGNDVVVAESSSESISRIMYLDGPAINNYAEIYTSSDGTSWEHRTKLHLTSVFAWKEQSISLTGRYIKIVPSDSDVSIMEMAFFDENNSIVPVKVISKEGHELFDEQQYVPDSPFYMNSTIFDEIYHPRTAYEFINGLPVYEWTHPPLGKVIIAAGIKMFGMTPWGWRFMGSLFGVLMVPVMYMFARRMFKNSFWAFFAAFIFSFDFMHYVQTRLATIDTYVTFFIILMYYFMYLYYTTDLNEAPLKKSLIPLLLSGISMGLAIAVKWQGVYAGAGIAVIFFYKLYKEIEKNSFNALKKKLVATIAFCFAFFVFIPVIIYVLSYIPYLHTEGADGFNTIIKNQTDMFRYHSTLEAEHPYSSPWWSWPFILRPIYYYSTYHGFVNGYEIKSGISSFGNPAVWWMGILAFFYAVKRKKNNDKDIEFFLLTAFASQILPWTIVSRTTFIYHFFPSIPFIVLMITYFFKNYAARLNVKLVFAYLIVVLILFVMFYPVLTGIPVAKVYVDIFLKWLPSWNLI